MGQLELDFDTDPEVCLPKLIHNCNFRCDHHEL